LAVSPFIFSLSSSLGAFVLMSDNRLMKKIYCIQM
jgi:hypothetical protein